jgi:glycine hydroxymethyltransferase
MILSHRERIEKINQALMPGLQGGPHNHNIAGICVGLGEALRPEFIPYAKAVVANAKALAAALERRKFTVVTGGTDKHLLVLDLMNQPLVGRKFARALAEAGIITNKSTMPQERRSPRDPSALRLGTPWVTTRGMGPQEMEWIAAQMRQVMEMAAPLASLEFREFAGAVRASPDLRALADNVRALCVRLPALVGARAPAATAASL